MTISSLSKTEAARTFLHELQAGQHPGSVTDRSLPKLPHVPGPGRWNNDNALTFAQREANLLLVALWIVEFDRSHLDMQFWHRSIDRAADNDTDFTLWNELPPKTRYHACGTTHCLAGFAQAMAGPEAFALYPSSAGATLLGHEAAAHFTTSQENALLFLQHVIDRNS